MTATPTTPATPTNPTALDAIRRIWGFDTLRPLQAEAINAALDRRDALVVLPTGGGKSLCYQVPPLVTDELTVVISPLIALMEDQVDGLRLTGYPAVALHSACTPAEQDDAYAALNTGSARLLFVSPERLLSDGFTDWLAELPNPSGPPGVRRFAIDEAHCISAWGHDFRPEYRQLATLRDRFPDACIHAFTATATERVREDITSQLGMRDPAILVGTFDRPNLIYRVVPRVDRDTQIAEVIARHTDGATIVYCISRKDTEAVADMLRDENINARPYHAGLTPERRRKVQEDFSREKLDVVVATVAFGMGIDRSNVRCVLHAALPKSIEAYQQETGRAGRDGLEAECVLLYSSADAIRWSRLFTMSAEESGSPPEVLQAQLDLLEGIQRLASGMTCRHKALSEHFDQPYPLPDCNACDVCLGENAAAPDATVIAQKIISCVARAIQHSGFGFGASHIVDVLRGSRTAKILDRGHDQLSTYNLLRDIPKPTITSYINQLIDQDLLTRDPGKFATLALSPASRDVLTGARQVTLLQPKHPVERAPVAEEVTLSTDELDLFDSLRTLRRQLAEERGVPPYIIFSDDTLRELAAVRPASESTMATVKGVGTQKLEAFSDAFITHIAAWCAEHDLATDARPGTRQARRERASTPRTISPKKRKSFELFDRGESVEAVAVTQGLQPRTITTHLAEWIASRKPESIAPWIDQPTYDRVAAAAGQVGTDFLKPVFEHLEGSISYEQIHIVVAHLRTQA
ncbi:MAG: DNA helicase RecQ [Planctomycetota bacterium]|nr:DNA helicase RecQ [Planctomycetota bacterium]